MNFIKYKPRFTVSTKDAITLGSKIIHIGIKAYERMGKPERIDLFYDLENKAIQIQKSENGRKVSLPNNYPSLSCRLSTLGFPLGVYRYKEDNVYVYEK